MTENHKKAVDCGLLLNIILLFWPDEKSNSADRNRLSMCGCPRGHCDVTEGQVMLHYAIERVIRTPTQRHFLHRFTKEVKKWNSCLYIYLFIRICPVLSLAMKASWGQLLITYHVQGSLPFRRAQNGGWRQGLKRFAWTHCYRWVGLHPLYM